MCMSEGLGISREPLVSCIMPTANRRAFVPQAIHYFLQQDYPRRELIILDEPTNGLDPQGTREVRTLIRQIAADGTTVFVSSHLLAEVDQICSHVGVMRAGQLVFQGTLEELRGRGAARILVRTGETTLAARVLDRLGLTDVHVDGREVTAQLGDLAPEAVCAELVHAGVPVAGLDTPRASLEDLFVELTGEGFDVNG